MKMKTTKRKMTSIALCVMMIMSAILITIEPTLDVEAANYEDSFFDENGIVITSRGLQAEDNGNWYIDFLINNQTSENYMLNVDKYEVWVNDFSYQSSFSSKRISAGGREIFKLTFYKNSLKEFLDERGESQINDIKVSFEISEYSDGSKVETVSVPLSSVELHYVPVKSVSFNSQEYTIMPGERLLLPDALSVNPSDATNKYIVEMTSNNRNVATANFSDYYTPYIYGNSEGTATITVTTLDGGKVATCKVNVVGGGVYYSNGEYYRINDAGYKYTYYFRDDVEEIHTLDGTIPMYRMYNKNSGEHFYTANYHEAYNLKGAGWSYERIAWFAPPSGEEVYRVYNPSAGDHHYTTNYSEVQTLVNLGWVYEGVAWHSGGNVKMLRAYNPNASTGTHHYTSSQAELESIVGAGWKDEGVAWYAVE